MTDHDPGRTLDTPPVAVDTSEDSCGEPTGIGEDDATLYGALAAACVAIDEAQMPYPEGIGPTSPASLDDGLPGRIARAVFGRLGLPTP